MFIEKQHVKLVDKIDGERILKKLEEAGRVCYKSERLITPESSKKFLSNIIRLDHTSVLEHESITVKAIVSRSVSHQLVRHRIASYSQESQRYVNYKKKGDIGFILPVDLKSQDQLKAWKESMKRSEADYYNLLELGAKPETAREVLPNSTRTEIIVTMNIRSWRNFFELRLGSGADPKIKDLAKLILKEFQDNVEVLFDDWEV